MPYPISNFLLAVEFEDLNTAKRKQGLKKRRVAQIKIYGIHFILK
jgi:hypothetical protein